VSGWQDEVKKAVAEAARSGEICDLTSRHEDEREVPAELIYDLCTRAADVHARGVRIRGALVIDPLDFDETRLRVRLGLFDSVLSSLRLENASARSVQLDRSLIAEGPVRLVGASIEGRLSMRGAKLTGTDSNGQALVADGMRVTGGVFLVEGFEAAGAVRLAGASIEGRQLAMRGAKLTGTDPGGRALVADGMRVTGGVFLEGFEAAGAVRLLAASIEGQLLMRGAKLTGTDSDGRALVADGMRVTGGVVLDGGFEAAGAVRLLGASIEGQLLMRGAKLTGTDSNGQALVADGMRVTGDVDLDRGSRRPERSAWRARSAGCSTRARSVRWSCEESALVPCPWGAGRIS
jgi:hypothetical protein